MAKTQKAVSIKAAHVSAAELRKALASMTPEEKAHAAAEAFAIAYAASREADVEAQAQGENAWRYYVVAIGHGYKADTLRDDLRDTFAEGSEREAFLSRCKNYKARVEILLSHGVALLDGDDMAEECTVGEFTGTLGGVAQKLLKAKATGKGAQKRNGKGSGKGEGTGDDEGAGEGAGGAKPLSMIQQAENVARAMAESIKLDANGIMADGEGIRLASILMETCPQVVLSMAKAINLKAIQTQAIRAAQAQDKAKAEAKAAERIKADAAALAREAKATKAKARGGKRVSA